MSSDDIYDSHIDKKQKTENMAADEEQKPQDLFTSVGEQAQEVDDQETNVAGSNEVRQTGAEDAEGHPVQEIESLCMNCHKLSLIHI